MKKQMSRRDFLRVASLGGLGLGMMTVASCAPQVVEKTVEVVKNVESTVIVKETVAVQQTVEVPQAAAEAVNINFFHAWHQDIAGPVIDPMIKQYMADHPGVIITQTAATPDALSPMILAAMAAGTPPDIAWGYTPSWQKAGQLIAIDDYLTKYNYEVDQIYPYLWEMFTVEGKKYGFPVENSSVAWWYRNDVLQEAGLTAPSPDWDWLSLMDYGQKLTKKTGNKVDRWGLAMPMPEWWYYITLLMEEGGSFLSADLTKPAFNNDGGLKALNFALSQVKAGITPPPGFTSDVPMFPNKLSGLSWDGPWRFGNYINELNLDAGVVMHPKCPDTGSNTSYVFGGALGVCKTTDVREDASMQFLVWFLGKDMNAQWGVQTGYLPIRVDSTETQVYKDFIAGKGKVMTGFLDVFKVGKAIPGQTTLPKFGDMQTIFQDECWEPVMLGKKAPEVGLADAEKKLLADPTLFAIS